MTGVRPFWNKLIPESWLLMTLVAVLLAVPRFVLMLSANYNSIAILFLLMWLAPFVFLGKRGRSGIGLTRPTRYFLLPVFFAVGFFASVVIYEIGFTLYQKSTLNWYVTVMNTFNKGDLIRQIKPHPGLFFLFCLPTLLLSPIGEEFFFRGMIQDSFTERFGEKIATLADALFFGFTHLAHYGIVITGSGRQILPSSLIWIALMMGMSLIFSLARSRSGSLWTAVLCHAGFNLGMMWSIFYLLN